MFLTPKTMEIVHALTRQQNPRWDVKIAYNQTHWRVAFYNGFGKHEATDEDVNKAIEAAAGAATIHSVNLHRKHTL